MNQMNLTEDGYDLVEELLHKYIKAQKTKAKVETLEFLEAGESKSKHLAHNGLIAHLYTQTAEGLLEKMKVFKL